MCLKLSGGADEGQQHDLRGWGTPTEGFRPEKAPLFPYSWSRDAAAEPPASRWDETGRSELQERKDSRVRFSTGRLPSQLSVQTLLLFPQEVSAERLKNGGRTFKHQDFWFCPPA